MSAIPFNDVHLGDELGALGPISGNIGALKAALKDLNEAVAGGQSAASIRPLFTSSVSLFSKPPSRLPSVLVSARTLEVPEFDPTSPDWTRAMQPSERRGPFLSAAGERIWIDTFLLPRLLTLEVIGPFNQVFTLARFSGVLGLGVSQTIRISTGSLWIATRWLVSGRPSNEFAGVRVVGGHVRIAGTVNASGDTIRLSGSWHVEFDFQTSASTPSTTPSPPGEDALAAFVQLPKNVKIGFDHAAKATLAFDDSSVDAYGSALTLTRNNANAFIDEQTQSLVLPATPSPSTFNFSTVRSDVWEISGQSPVSRSGWSWPMATVDSSALGEAAGAGHAWLELAPGFSLDWKGKAAGIVRTQKSVLTFMPGEIAAYVVLAGSGAGQTLELWTDQAADPPRNCSAEIPSGRGSAFQYLSRPGFEAILFSGELDVHLDRPLAADGGRIRIHFAAGWFFIVESSASKTAGILAYDVTAANSPHISYCLENGLVKARLPVWFTVSGAWDGNQVLPSGLVSLRFPYRFVLPILPDPYAANFDAKSPTDVDSGWAAWVIEWPDPKSPSLRFSVLSPIAPPSNAQFNEDRAVQIARDPRINSRVLLDLSSNADQFGVLIPNARVSAPQASGLTLVAPANDLAVMTLPPLSWEPMLTRAPKPNEIMSGEIPLPPPPNDGGAAVFTADTVELARIEPIPLLTAYLGAIGKRHHFLARLPLPFGLIALVNTNQNSHDPKVSAFAGSVGTNQPEFPDDLAGGMQLVFSGPKSSGEATDPVMPGFTYYSDSNYVLGVLSNNISFAFNNAFGLGGGLRGIPLRTYELSGYGASLFSDWKDQAATGPAIIEARFDAIVGRVSHEVIQMQSGLYPYSARMVRTITMDRMPGGWILREDSGWVATTDGEFLFPGSSPAFSPAQVHKGTITAVRKIRNVELDGMPFTTAAGIGWQRVSFNADIDFADGADPRLVVESGGTAAAVPSQGIVGWIQLSGPLDGTGHARPPYGPEIADLLATYGPAAGPVNCQLLLGGTATEPGLRFHATGFDVSTADDGAGTFNLAVALRGTPALPRDGAWSVARMAATETAPSSLDRSIPVPIVRATAPTAGFERWHLADPKDILNLADGASPSTRYGLLQSFGTQKVFFSRPRVGNEARPITLPSPPQLADVGALLHAAGIFPGLDDAFNFKLLKDLAVNGGELKFSETFEIADAGGNPRQSLLADLGGADGIRLVIDYEDEQQNKTKATVTVDPAASPRWTVELSRVSFCIFYQGAKLIRLFARVRATEGSAPSIDNVNVKYESILSCLETIFTNIQQVAKFLPGGADAGLSISFSAGHLTIRNSFALPNLPLGAGQITDIAVNMGLDVALTPFDVSFVAGLGSSEKPFNWIVSPLSGTGAVVVGINSKGLDLLIQAGLGLGLAIDLAIASGSASVALAIEIDTGPSPFELKGILSGRASVDVLQGLASATITLAAGLGIVPPSNLISALAALPPPNPIPSFTIGLIASVSVGIHLSVCWVVDVDFDGYWQFRQDITTPSIPIPLV